MKKSIKIVFLIAFLSMVWSLSLADEQLDQNEMVDQIDTLEVDTLRVEEVEKDSLFYSGDEIFYDVLNRKIHLKGGASLDYHTSSITADSIYIDMERDQAYTLGRSLLRDGNQLLIGREVLFDLDTQWGMIRDGASQFEHGYYYGAEIRKVDEEIYDVDHGNFTTCDAEHPHFYIKTDRLRLYQNDKIVAKPVIFYVNHFPVFGLPFATISVKRGRHSGILIPSPGYNSTQGKYIENIALYLAYKDYADATIYADYYERTGWEIGFMSDYIRRYIFSGNVHLRLQRNVETPDVYTHDWLFESRHSHDFGHRRTFDSNLRFISSSRVFEGDVDIEERLAEQVTSSVAYKRPLFERFLYINAQYTDDFKQEIKNITLPSITYSLPSKPVYELFTTADNDEEAWWKNLSYSYNFRAIHTGVIRDPDADIWDVLYKSKKDEEGEYINQHNAGIQHRTGLRYSYTMRGWLNLSQNVSYNEAWYDRDKQENQLVRAYDYSTTSGLSFSLYGTRVYTEPLYVSAVRHVATPQLSFTYKPDFTDNQKYYTFSGININSTAKQRRLSLSLENKWQLKLKQTESLHERRLNDFFRINTSVNYDFERDEKPFSNILHNINLNPNAFRYSILNLSVRPNGRIVQDPYDMSFKDISPTNWDWGVSDWSAGITSRLSLSGDATYMDYFPIRKNEFWTEDLMMDYPEEEEEYMLSLEEMERLAAERNDWSLSFEHNYRTNRTSYKAGQYTSNLKTSVSLMLTKNWKIAYDNFIDMKTNDIVSHNVTITRELDCWRIFFRYTKQGDFWNYQLRLFNIKLPDALQFRTSDRKR